MRARLWQQEIVPVFKSKGFFCRANASKRTKLIQAVYVPRFMRGIPVRRSMQDCLDAVHKAQHVGDGGCFSVQILDAFALAFFVF